MPLDHQQIYCPTCRRNQMFERPAPNHIVHLILSIVTCGIWLIVWLAACAGVGAWMCPGCGSQTKPNNTAVYVLVFLLGLLVIMFVIVGATRGMS